MFVIGQRNFTNGGPDQYISIQRDELVRQFGFSNTWTRLRVGLLMSINTTATIYAGRLTVGVCTYGNPTQGASSWSAQHVIGFQTPSQNVYAFNLSTTGTDVYHDGAGATAIERIGNTYTIFGGVSGSGNVFTHVSGKRSVHIFEFQKGNGTQNWKAWGTNSTALIQNDYQYSDMLSALQDTVDTNPKIGGVTMGTWPAGGSGTLTESAGVLDAVTVSWFSAYYPLEIYGLAVYRIT